MRSFITKYRPFNFAQDKLRDFPRLCAGQASRLSQENIISVKTKKPLSHEKLYYKVQALRLRSG